MDIKDLIIALLSYIKQPKKRSLISKAYKLRGKTGIEIGGPTVFFGLRGGFPIYVFARKIDGVNFSNETVWEGKIKDGNNYQYYKNKTGYQYITEATNLQRIPDNSYDFVLSSHNLEHVANPIKALKEWSRVLKEGGKSVLILPDKNYTFDHGVTIQHLSTSFLITITTQTNTTLPILKRYSKLMTKQRRESNTKKPKRFWKIIS